MMRLILTCVLICSPLLGISQDDSEKFEEIRRTFTNEYLQLNIPQLELSYELYLSKLGHLKSLEYQQKTFKAFQEQINEISSSALRQDQHLSYELIKYECENNLKRVENAIAFINNSGKVNDRGIYHQSGGPNWYKYLVSAWTSAELTPEEISDYGLTEVKRILTEMQKVRKETSHFKRIKNSKNFFTNDISVIEAAFREVKEIVEKNVSKYFPDFPDLPELKVARGTNSLLTQTPGYYGDNTFFYNLFDDPYDLRQVDWMFLHEGIPGHHFQVNYEGEIEVSYPHQVLTYSGFREGWAAYIEGFGKELGLYKTPHHYYSKLEWDLIRSVRLILDVGINYEGWTNKEALTEWKKHIKDQDDIGLREINRMRRWPAQVLTYKIGEKVMREMRDREKNRQQGNFNLKEFHQKLLSHRTIPISLIDKIMF